MQLHVNNSARRPRQPDASGQDPAPIQFRVAALDAELVTQADGAGKPGDLSDAVSPGESAVTDRCSFKCKAIRAKRHHGNDQVGSNTNHHRPQGQDQFAVESGEGRSQDDESGRRHPAGQVVVPMQMIRGAGCISAAPLTQVMQGFCGLRCHVVDPI